MRARAWLLMSAAFIAALFGVKPIWPDTARIAAFDNPLVSELRATIEATGTPRDESYDPMSDMGGGDFEFDPSFRAKAAFAQNRAEMDVLKRKYLRDERFRATIVTPVVRSGAIAWVIVVALLIGILFALFSGRRLIRRAAVKVAAYGVRAQSAVTSAASDEVTKLRDEVRAEAARQSEARKTRRGTAG